MEYKGKLYGHLGNRRYFDTGKTADDWDNLEKRIAELEAVNQALLQADVSGSLRIAAQKLLDAVNKHHPVIAMDTQLDLYMAYHEVKEALSNDR